MTLDELITAFKLGVLKESEGDILLLDKSRFELMTDKKGFSFDEHTADVAFALLEKLGVPADGV